jgi:hypothetical protein
MTKYVIVDQYNDANTKWNDSDMLVSNTPDYNIFIEMKKLTDHPVCIGCDPKDYGKVVTQLRHKLSCSYRDHDSNDQCGKDHGDAKRFPDQAPANVFDEPEYNVEIFHSSERDRDTVARFRSHLMLFWMRNIK